MGPRTLGLFLLPWLALVMLNRTVDGVDSNLTSGGLLWSTVKEEDDLLHHDDQVKDDLDGGFSSLDGMLQWAISIVIFTC